MKKSLFQNKKVYPERSRRGFTLLELLVVMAIIVVIALVAIPAFSKYGKKTIFRQSMEEVKSLIEQMHIMSKNPEKGISKYAIYTEDIEGIDEVTKIVLVKRETQDLIIQDQIIKEIDLDGKYLIFDINIDSNPDTDEDYLSCESPGEVCCRQDREGDIATKYCSDGESFGITKDAVYIEIKNHKMEAKADRKAKFYINPNPFSVKIEYEDI